MKIENRALLSVCDSDIDADGVLRIPDGVIKIISLAKGSLELFFLHKGVGSDLPRLKTIYCPPSLTEIGEYAFSGNKNLTAVYLNENVISCSRNAFFDCKNIHTLQIPKSWLRFDANTVALDSNVKTLIRNNREYRLNKYQNVYYVENSNRTIADIEIKFLERPTFVGDEMRGTREFGVVYDGVVRVERTLRAAVLKTREFKIKKKFMNKLDAYSLSKNTASHKNIHNLLSSAFWNQLDGCIKDDRISMSDRKKLSGYELQIPELAKHIQNFHDKYQHANNVMDLVDCNIDDLKQMIMPISDKQEKTRSVTKYIKNHPLNNNGMYKLVADGSKSDNPGSFPYEWLNGADKSEYGKITQKLHSLFSRATFEMYDKDDSLKGDVIRKLSSDLCQITGKDINISYFNSGHFGKVFKMVTDGSDQAYALKIYHCDRDYSLFNFYDHNTEIQNSFLLSGRKYMGNIKFRKIMTAGLSNQRGERYMIYPWARGDVSKTPCNELRYLRRFYTTDFERSDGCIGGVLTDMGGIKINQEYYEYPFMTKIVNTVVDRPWDDLVFVLNNYSPAQIDVAIKFIQKNIFNGMPRHKTIMAKVNFLENKIRHRLPNTR
ncbi:leucine-rich repeat domain-containing protein [Lachnospiraceae bacterium OttesenSCG-928-E19]|nr:leucine-rich repeat domain-containing protein [Lachnospiraceae bacterium OttesenSCG-928-E19]